MKKIFVLLLAAAMLLCSCGKAVDENGKFINPYPVEDITMEDSIFDFEELSSYQPAVEYQEEIYGTGSAKPILYSSAEFGVYANTKIFAYYGKPDPEEFKKPKNGYPAMVLVHGGSGQAEYSWVNKWTKRGYVAIAMDLFGNMATAEFAKIQNIYGGPQETSCGSFWAMNGANEQTWTYQRVANIIHANNVLRADKDVDADRIGITGISWGAYLTCITSGVDKRFAFFAPVYGCGFLDEDGDSVIFGPTFAALKTQPQNYQKWMKYYDPSSYLSYATKPMLFVGGVNMQEPFSCRGRQKSIDLVKGKTFLSIRPSMVHSQSGGDGVEEVFRFAEFILYGKNEVLKLDNAPKFDGNTVSVVTENNIGIESVQLVYTQNELETNTHTWTFSSAAAAISGGGGSLELPAGATAYFFFITDVNGGRWSTNIVFAY